MKKPQPTKNRTIQILITLFSILALLAAAYITLRPKLGSLFSHPSPSELINKNATNHYFIQSDDCYKTILAPEQAPLTTAQPPIEIYTPPFNSSSYTFIKGGVPFPRGALHSPEQLRLENQKGEEIKAQFSVLACWPDHSIKSVLVSTLTKGKRNTTTYKLHYGSGIKRTLYTTPLNIQETENSFTITTGPTRFEINKHGSAVIDQVWLDLNRNGNYEASEIVARSGELFLVDAFSNEEFSISRDSRVQFAIEESGPLRTVIRMTGALANHTGDNLTNFIIRLSFYANLPDLDIEYTLIDIRPEKDVRTKRSQLALSASAYGFRFDHTLQNARYSFGGDKGGHHEGALNTEKSIRQAGSMNFSNGFLGGKDTDNGRAYSFRYSGVGSGHKAAGWVSIYNNKAGISSYVKDFWQQFPNELSASPSRLTISLHPAWASLPKPNTSYPELEMGGPYKRPNTFYSPREGIAKTSRIKFIFHNSTPSNAEVAAINTDFQQHRPLITTSADWYANSRAFGEISASSSHTDGYDKHLLEGIYLRSLKRGYRLQTYGWRDFGDRMRGGWETQRNNRGELVRIPSFYNDTHVGSNNFFKQYLRTLDERWWALAEISTQHFMDIDVSHTHRRGYWRDNRARKIWTPPGEVMAIKHNMVDHDSRNIHKGHAHVSGLSDYYLLTGDRRSYEVLMEIGDFWRTVTPYFYPTPRPVNYGKSNRAYAEAERDFGWPLYVMNEVVRVSNDADYHNEVSAQVVKHLIEWWKTPQDKFIGGKVVGYHDASKGTGWWAMDDLANGLDGRDTGVGPWMAGSLLTNLITFYENDQDYRSSIDHNELRDMLFQGMNYTVKYGWEDSRKFLDRDYFVYAESRRKYDGGATHIVYPLAYLHRLLEQEKLKDNVTHPEWYDTSDQWLPIAKDYYQRFQTGPFTSQGYGFYGYEMVFPTDYFKLMEELAPARQDSPTQELDASDLSSGRVY